MTDHRLPALEFFAGGGLARLGLKDEFRAVWSNDMDPMKAAAWRANFGEGLDCGDVWDVDAARVPDAALAWASFPCQDVSLAGARGGLEAPRSGAFFGFARVIGDLIRAGRAPAILCLENVSGLLTSGAGRDFGAMLETLGALGYRSGALEIDAAAFVPQSRPRLFVIAVRDGTSIPSTVRLEPEAAGFGLTPGLRRAVSRLSPALRAAHMDWRVPDPPPRNTTLMDVVSDEACCWWSDAKTAALTAQLSPAQRTRLAGFQDGRARAVGAVYRRMRMVGGVKHQRAEARFDGLAGCLRTPAGGSSRQFLLFVDGPSVRARAISAREAMTLMGVSDAYKLPVSETAGLKIAGDGVCVPVVRWLARHLLAPLARASGPSG